MEKKCTHDKTLWNQITGGTNASNFPYFAHLRMKAAWRRGRGRWAQATEKGSVRSQTYNSGSKEPHAALTVGDRRARSLWRPIWAPTPLCSAPWTAQRRPLPQGQMSLKITSNCLVTKRLSSCHVQDTVLLWEEPWHSQDSVWQREMQGAEVSSVGGGVDQQSPGDLWKGCRHGELGSATSSWGSSYSGKKVAVRLLCLTNQSSEYLLSTREAKSQRCRLVLFPNIVELISNLIPLWSENLLGMS